MFVEPPVAFPPTATEKQHVQQQQQQPPGATWVVSATLVAKTFEENFNIVCPPYKMMCNITKMW